MKISAIPIGVAVAASVALACDATNLGGPSPWPPQSQQPGPASLPAFPPLTHAGTIYNEKTPLYSQNPVDANALASRYVLYDDGTFELQLVTSRTGSPDFGGRYQISGGAVSLSFAVPSWVATASLQNGELSVTYNDEMRLSDFEDEVYEKAP